jgi:hypothetical protein
MIHDIIPCHYRPALGHWQHPRITVKSTDHICKERLTSRLTGSNLWLGHDGYVHRCFYAVYISIYVKTAIASPTYLYQHTFLNSLPSTAWWGKAWCLLLTKITWKIRWNENMFYVHLVQDRVQGRTLKNIKILLFAQLGMSWLNYWRNLLYAAR